MDGGREGWNGMDDGNPIQLHMGPVHLPIVLPS